MSAAHQNGPAIRRIPSQSAYPPTPNTVAQTIPPAALKMRNRIGGNPFAPASSAAKARSKATKRPKKTIFPPWRANRYRPRFLFRSSSPIRYPHRASNDVPNSRPTQKPMLSPTDRPACSRRNNVAYIPRMSVAGKGWGTDQDCFPRQRNTGALQHHNNENCRVAVVCQNVLNPATIEKVHLASLLLIHCDDIGSLGARSRARQSTPRWRRTDSRASDQTEPAAMGAVTRSG